MGVCVIEQKPIINQLPVGQDIMFVISNQSTVANQVRVKFCVEVHVDKVAINTGSSNALIGVFKNSPNAAGVGIFDMRSILENYVKPDNLCDMFSRFKTIQATRPNRFPIHIIDQYTRNQHSVRNVVLQFFMEYLDSDPTSSTYNTIIRETGSTVNSREMVISNGYIKYTDEIYQSGDDFSYNPSIFNASTSSNRWMTNAPTVQNVNIEDYMTIAYYLASAVVNTRCHEIRIVYRKDNASLGISDSVVTSTFFGGTSNWSQITNSNMVYFGMGPANLRGWSANFLLAEAAGMNSYSVEMINNVASRVLQKLTININCPDIKGFESIRLCWLNQWGAWDYYTFTKKSTRKFATKPTTYQNLRGTWNDSRYRIDSFTGGQKTFRVNTVEKISINTDFIPENENVMFEELINSPEVYLLNGYSTASPTFSANNTYVVPVRLTTKGMTRKTLPNNNMIQYNFDIEKTNVLRTQAT